MKGASKFCEVTIKQQYLSKSERNNVPNKPTAMTTEIQ